MDTVWAFWNGSAGGSSTIAYYLGVQVYKATNSVLMDLYDLDLQDQNHHFGSPVLTKQKSLTGASPGAVIPNEVALTLSYRSAYGTDPEHDGVTRPRAQDRGRIYIGPLGTAAIFAASAPNGTQYPVALPALITNIMNAASTLNSAVPASNFLWCVWSRKDQLLKPVAFKACDNSFDTQRRREVEPPGLQTWVAI